MLLLQEREEDRTAHVKPIYSTSPLTVLQNKIGSKVKINHAPGVHLEKNGIPIESKYFSLPTDNGKGLLGEYLIMKILKASLLSHVTIPK